MKFFLRNSVFMILLAVPAAWSSDYQVVFETIGCNGESGFVTAKVEDVYKIEDAGCSVPGKSGERLKQILIKNSSGGYDIFTLTQDEAKTVVGDMKIYMRARLKALENSNTLIIDKK